MNQHSIANFKCTGTGPCLVLLHGFCEDSGIWDDFVPELSRKYSVIVPDLPGFGESAALESTTIEDMADAVCKVLQKIGASRFVAVGHSMGGYVALALAEKHPDATSGLMLFHSTAMADCEKKRLDRQAAIDSIEQYGTRPFLTGFFRNLFTEEYALRSPKTVEKLKQRVESLPSKGLTNAISAMMHRTDKTALLSQLNCPIGFIAGDKDSFVPLEKTLVECYLPKMSEIHVLPNVGHAGMFERSVETMEMVDDFTRFCYEVA